MSIFESVYGLAVNKLESLQTLMSMTKLEVRLARLSIYPLIINICSILVILMTTWAAAMTMLGYGIILMSDNIWIALTAVILFNLLILTLLKRILSYNIRKMSFQKTRQYFGEIVGNAPDVLPEAKN